MEVKDWKAHATREAVAILAESMPLPPVGYQRLVALVALGWLQGCNYGQHEALAAVEDSFDELRSGVKVGRYL